MRFPSKLISPVGKSFLSILIFGILGLISPLKSNSGFLIFASIFGISAFNFISGILFSKLIFASAFGIFGFISTPGILPSIFGILPFISTFGIFPSKEALGIFILFLFKLISGELILISLILLLRSICLSFKFVSIPRFKEGLIFWSSGFFMSPSIFTSPFILGIFPWNINVSSFPLILIFGIFPSALILGPLIFAFAFGISTFPFKSTSPVFKSTLGALIFFPGISPFNSKLGPFILGPSKFIFAEGIFASKPAPISFPLIFRFGLLISKLPFPGISPVILVSGKLAFMFKSFPLSFAFLPTIIPVISS